MACIIAAFSAATQPQATAGALFLRFGWVWFRRQGLNLKVAVVAFATHQGTPMHHWRNDSPLEQPANCMELEMVGTEFPMVHGFR